MSTRIVVDRPGGPEVLRVDDAPPPVPGREQLVVAAEASGVAFADVLMRQGRYPQQPKAPFTHVSGPLDHLRDGPDRPAG